MQRHVHVHPRVPLPLILCKYVTLVGLHSHVHAHTNVQLPLVLCLHDKDIVAEKDTHESCGAIGVSVAFFPQEKNFGDFGGV